MRRNRNMGRSSGGNLNMSGGPLLTEHLKDIDLELDLLKRKREMLEQQTQLFQPFNQPQRNFNQQPFYLLEPKQGGSHCDFSHLYNDAPQQYRKPFAKKRQSDSDWQNQSFPKRSAGNGSHVSNYSPPSHRHRSPRPYNTSNQQPRATSFNNGQGQKKSIGQKIANQKQHTQQRPSRKFEPTKVTKPKAAAPPPNKIASKPVADRGNLVATAIKSVAEVQNRVKEALRLVPDKIPTNQMTGRLELALGNILRDIKERCAESEHSEILRTFSAQRIIKNAIRERIRTVMLGKIVGKTQEITSEYRDMFPKETDIDIINKALEANGLKPLTNSALGPIVSEEPVKSKNNYYKENVTKLLQRHLGEMFDKLEDVYKKEFSGQTNTPASVEQPVAEVSQDNVKTEESEQMSEENPQTVTEENNEVKVEGAVEAAKGGDEAANGGDEAANGGDEAAKGGDEAAKAKVDAQTADDIRTNYMEFKNAVGLNPLEIKRMIPHILKRHLGIIVRLLYVNFRFKNSLTAITDTTKDLLAKQKASEPVALSQPPQVYYVKVMGIPQLPKRNLMQTFLQVFEPASIKRHKNIRNLLFVGLRSEKSVDEIVKADGTLISNMKLSIRVCDANSGKSEAYGSPMPANQETTEPNRPSKNDSFSSNDLLGTELDEQITDLLSSIRNSDETKCDEEGQISEEGNITEEGKVSEERNITEEGKTDINSKKSTEANGCPADAADEPNADKALDNIKEELLEENKGTEKTEDVEAPANGGETQPEISEGEKPVTEANAENNDQVSELKTNALVKGTPTRASNRLASTPGTPSSIRTRRASRLPN